MLKSKVKQRAIHSPNLNTVIMVENAIRSPRNSIITVPELKKKLPKQVNHITLMVILGYLEDSNKIYVSIRGITWIHNTNTYTKDMIENGTRH